jgi:hypothetical protein
MEQELNYLSEKIEDLDSRIAYLLDEGYKKDDIKELIHQHSMLENILNALTLSASTGSNLITN